MVGMTTLSNWITSILVPLLTLLVKLSLLEFDNAPSCAYPLVSSMVQNENVNTPLVLYSWVEWMDEFVDYMVLIDFPTPCFNMF
jgi:hypothetical protein